MEMTLLEERKKVQEQLDAAKIPWERNLCKLEDFLEYNTLRFSLQTRLSELDAALERTREIRSNTTLSEDQKVVFDRLLHFFFEDSSSFELTLGGLAGTGKSTIIAELLNSSMFKRLCKEDVHIATYTGKAAERLMRTSLKNSGFTISTTHRLLYEFHEDKHTSEFKMIEKESLPRFIIIDEASMLPKDFYECMLKDTKGVTKVLFVGDHGQLPPITKKDEQPFNLMDSPTIKLEKIHRQAEGSEIAALAFQIREARNISEVKAAVRESSLAKVNAHEAIEMSQSLAEQTSWDDVIHLVYTNRKRCEINHTLLSRRSQNVVGAPIICLRNKIFGANEMLANGSRGILEFIDTDSHDLFQRISATFPTTGKLDSLRADKKAWLNPQYTYPKTRNRNSREMIPFDFAFSVTCHKAQGCGWPTVFIWLNDINFLRDLDMLKRWLYTAITRAEERVVFVV